MEIFQELRFGSKWFNMRVLVGDHICAGIFHIPQDQLWGQSWSPDRWGIFLPVGLDLGLLNGRLDVCMISWGVPILPFGAQA